MKDQQAKLHEDQERQRWKVANAHAKTKDIEAHYRARLIRLLERLGIGPVAACKANDPVDLLVAGWPVELKVCRARKSRPNFGTARPRAEYYQTCLGNPKRRHQLNGSFVVVLCVDQADRLWPYVIPRAAIGERRTIEITSHPLDYAGQWAGYLAAYDQLTTGGNDDHNPYV